MSRRRRLRRHGGPEIVEVGGKEIAVFDDPEPGMTYVARRVERAPEPVVQGAVAMPCVDCGSEVWVSPAGQRAMSKVVLVCEECLPARMAKDKGEATFSMSKATLHELDLHQLKMRLREMMG